MITSRAYLVGMMGFCFYLILLFNTNLPNQFYALSWLSVGVLVSSFGVALLTLLGLESEWRIANARVAEDLEETDAQTVGSGPSIEITLGNSGSFHKTDLLLEVILHNPQRDEEFSRSFLIEALPAGSSLTSELPLSDLPRGRYRIQSLTIHAGDVLGLFRVRRRFRLKGRSDVEDLIVSPAVAILSRENAGTGSGSLGAAQRSMLGQGHGDEFRGTRLYVPGDDLRTVHWKSTARQGQLVVKEFHQHEQIQRLVVWDGGAGFDFGEEPHTATEFSLRLTMSLCRALAERGRACGLLRLDAHPLYLPPARGRGSGNLGVVAEALADADASRATALDVALGPFLRHLGGTSEVILVTPQPDAAVARAALLLRTHGAHVTIAMVSAGAFSAEIRPNRRAEFTSGDYQAQVQRLRENGFAVTLAPADTPAAWSGEVEIATLRGIVRETLQSPVNARVPV